MRIAFDLDDTLIPSVSCFPTEPRRLGLGAIFREEIRLGAIDLLRGLSKDGHEIWIYTTSLRSHVYLHSWFWFLGIPLVGVVNGSDHRFHGCPGSKHPPAFGIDVLVDDSEGVVMEGNARGFRVVRVLPSDSKWSEVVQTSIGGESDARSLD